MGRAQRSSRTHPIRPRVTCPDCKRSIAVTFNGTSTPTLRSHVSEPGKPCPKSGRAVNRTAMEGYRDPIYRSEQATNPPPDNRDPAGCASEESDRG